MKDLNYFKKELNNILNRQLEALEKEGVKKSFSELVEILCKSSSRSHLVAKRIQAKNAKTGKVYMKTVYVNPNKVNGLKKYHEQDYNNAKIAIGKLKKKIDECKNSQELLNLVLKNKGRFSDEQGYPLPIVEELKDYASKKNDELETPSKRRSIQDIQKENSESYKKKQYYSFGFKEVILSKEKLRKLAQKAKKAEFDNECKIDFNDLYNSVGQYLQKLLTESNDEKKWIKSPFFDNARIRFEGQSYSHFFTDKNGNDRPYDEIVKRAKCLGYVKDILRGRGVKASYSMNEKGQTAFVIMGRADIDGTNTAIKVIIKAKKNKYFYLSLNNFGEIKKSGCTFRRSNDETVYHATAYKKGSRNLAVAKENPNTQPIESLSDSNINSKVDSVNDKDVNKSFSSEYCRAFGVANISLNKEMKQWQQED